MLNNRALNGGSQENIQPIGKPSGDSNYNLQDIYRIIETQQMTINKLTVEVKRFFGDYLQFD